MENQFWNFGDPKIVMFHGKTNGKPMEKKHEKNNGFDGKTHGKAMENPWKPMVLGYTPILSNFEKQDDYLIRGSQQPPNAQCLIWALG